jgi:hypothetical protein
MAVLVDLEKFVAAAKAAMNELEKDYSETEKSYRGGRGAEVDKRLHQLKGVREGMAEARKAMNRALREVTEA